MEMVSNAIFVLIITTCVIQINARTYFDTNWGDSDNYNNLNNHVHSWRTSNVRGKSSLLDLNDDNNAKSQQVFLGPFIRFMIRILPRGILIIPSTALKRTGPTIYIDPNDGYGADQEELYQSIKHKKAKKSNKTHKPEYRTV